MTSTNEAQINPTPAKQKITLINVKSDIHNEEAVKANLIVDANSTNNPFHRPLIAAIHNRVTSLVAETVDISVTPEELEKAQSYCQARAGEVVAIELERKFYITLLQLEPREIGIIQGLAATGGDESLNPILIPNDVGYALRRHIGHFGIIPKFMFNMNKYEATTAPTGIQLSLHIIVNCTINVIQ